MRKKNHLIMGRNCIAELLRIDPQRIVRVYTSQKEREDALYKQLLHLQIPITTISKKELSQMVDSESHQSFVAVVNEREEVHLPTLIKSLHSQKTGLIVMLDSIFDPQNLGAIFRASECFGVNLIIYSKNRGAGVTPVTSKTSAGASELVPHLSVSNLVETMKGLQKEGFWSVASEVSERAESLYSFDFPDKTLLILGSEGKGVQPLLSKKCDFHVRIPMQGHIDSLNVSQAAAVFLSAFQRKISG